jgi:hypothetical protein
MRLDLAVHILAGALGILAGFVALWRMSFALLIAAFSFFLGQAKVIPKPIRIIPHRVSTLTSEEA